MKRLGVVIARFQCHELTVAHKHLLKKAAMNCDRCVVLIGCDAIPRKREPLDYPLRERMVRDWWTTDIGDTDLIVMPLLNRQSNDDWARSVDQLVDAVNLGGKVTLFCGPDGAGPCYAKHGGRHPIEVIESFGMHANSVRANLLPRHTEDFRAGMIYSSERRYVSPYLTVDVLIFSPDGEHVLLAQKAEEPFWRLVGGFVNVGEAIEDAVRRETEEETKLDLADIVYAGSAKIDDWRYREGPETIVSAVFAARAKAHQNARASDDIARVEWFDPTATTIKIILYPSHQLIYELAFGKRDALRSAVPV